MTTASLQQFWQAARQSTVHAWRGFSVADTARRVGIRLTGPNSFVQLAYRDYKTVFVDFGESCARRPGKVTLYAAICTSLGYAAHSAPSLTDFEGRVVGDAALLAELPPRLRRPAAQAHVAPLMHDVANHTLHALSLGVATVIVRGPPRPLATYQTQHWSLHHHVAGVVDRVVDVGVAGHFLLRDRCMHQYDDPDA